MTTRPGIITTPPATLLTEVIPELDQPGQPQTRRLAPMGPILEATRGPMTETLALTLIPTEQLAMAKESSEHAIEIYFHRGCEVVLIVSCSTNAAAAVKMKADINYPDGEDVNSPMEMQVWIGD